MNLISSLAQRVHRQHEPAGGGFPAALMFGSLTVCAHVGQALSADFAEMGSAAELIPFAERVLRSTLPEYAKDLQISPVGKAKSWPCRDFRAAFLSSNRSHAAVKVREVVSVEVVCADGKRATVSQWFSMSGEIPVLVATRDIGRNERLTVADVSTQTRSLAEASYSAPLEPDDLSVPVRPVRDLRPGDVLSKATITPAPEVAAGEPVEVVYTQGKVRIALRAEAESDAKLGERVRVIREAGQEPLVARVIGVGKAEVVQ